VLNSLFGFGISRLLNGEQRLQQGVLNTWVDSLALVLNPALQAIKSTLATVSRISALHPAKLLPLMGN
jgi:hypothetical protein